MSCDKSMNISFDSISKLITKSSRYWIADLNASIVYDAVWTSFLNRLMVAGSESYYALIKYWINIGHAADGIGKSHNLTIIWKLTS